MPDEESTEHQFVQQVLSNFNPLESQMGEEAYKANVANVRANTELIQAHTAVRRAYAAVMTVAVFLFILCGLPVIVFLWKWAMGA